MNYEILTSVVGFMGLALIINRNTVTLTGRMEQLRRDMTAEIGGVRAEFRTEIGGLRTELGGQIGVFRRIGGQNGGLVGHRQTHSVRVCSPPSRRVAPLRPRPAPRGSRP